MLKMKKNCKSIFESYPKIPNTFNLKINDVLTKSNIKKQYSHRINGRWENQYISIDLVPEIKIIFAFACKMGKSLVKKSLVVPYQQLGFQTNEFWFNISDPGDVTGWHDHKENAKLSGVYYICVPKYSGHLRFREKNGNIYREWSMKSEQGKMIIFNSDLEHSVEKNGSNEKRISLAFNLYTLPLRSTTNSESYSSNKFYS